LASLNTVHGEQSLPPRQLQQPGGQRCAEQKVARVDRESSQQDRQHRWWRTEQCQRGKLRAAGEDRGAHQRGHRDVQSSLPSGHAERRGQHEDERAEWKNLPRALDAVAARQHGLAEFSH
jgi:hypothetical protein